MSAKAPHRIRIRRLIFDSFSITYTILILALAAHTASATLGLTQIELTQDFFLSNFTALVWMTLAVFGLAAGGSGLFAKLEIPTIGAALFADERTRPEFQNKKFFRSFWGLHLSFIFIATIFISLRITEASLYELLDRDGLAGAWRLWSGLSNPNFSLLSKAVVEAIETIFIAFLATIIAIPISFVLAFFCAKNIMTHPASFAVYAVLRLAMNVSRSVEPLIWALIFTVWVGVGPFAGMLALTIHSIASLTKYYSEILESADDKPIDGIRSTGANKIQIVWFAIVPQIILPYIGMTVYRWDTNVRMATVIGLVGGGGIGTLLIQYQGQAMWPEVGCIILVIAVIVWLMDVGSAYVREALK